MRINNPGPRIAPQFRANQGRLPLPAASDSSSPGESESEDSRTTDSGTEDSGEGLAVDSDDSDPPDMRGMSLLSWGSYAGCLDWCMSVGGSQRRLGFTEGLDC